MTSLTQCRLYLKGALLMPAAGTAGLLVVAIVVASPSHKAATEEGTLGKQTD